MGVFSDRGVISLVKDFPSSQVRQTLLIGVKNHALAETGVTLSLGEGGTLLCLIKTDVVLLAVYVPSRAGVSSYIFTETGPLNNRVK